MNVFTAEDGRPHKWTQASFTKFQEAAARVIDTEAMMIEVLVQSISMVVEVV